MAKKRPPVKPGEAEAALDMLGLAALCDEIAEGKSLRKICEELGISIGRGSLGRWIALDPARKAAVEEARIAAAESEVELAGEKLATAKTPFQLAKAKEEGYHHRWKASKMDPRRYGDKVAVGGAADLPPIESKSTLNVAGLTDEQLRALASIAVHGS